MSIDEFIPKMSYSSACLIHKCQRKYWLNKVAKMEPDPDANTNYLPFRFGKAYHEILEKTFHGRDNITKMILDTAWKDHEIERDDQFRIFALVNEYIALRKRSLLQCIVTESQIFDEDTVGYIDGILTDSEGYWYILDLKTASRISKLLISRLHRDLQLNFYAGYLKDICASTGLDINKFAGIRYNVAQKFTATPREGESMKEFSQRVKCAVVEYVVPSSKLSPSVARDFVMSAREKQKKLFKIGNIEETEANPQVCEDYMRPCEHWSKCYGVLSSVGGVVSSATSKDMTDQTIYF